MERKYYIDNLRWLAILLLFPFHAAQIWGGDTGGFYVWSHLDKGLYVFATAVYPWYMTLLFVIAGMSCKYALTKRTKKQFIAERTKKLLVPFVFGVLVLAPVMTYIAEVYFNGYKGSYIQQYVLFFTKETDLTGYRGGFTPGHFWFLLYLYIISAAALGFIALLEKRPSASGLDKLPYWGVILLFVPEWLCLYILNIGGKSIGQFTLLYLIGYYIFTQDSVQQRLKRYRFISLALCAISGTAYVYLYCFREIKSEWITGLYVFYGWTGILTLLGIGQTSLDFHNKCSAYLSRASFPVYILHMPIVAAVGYYVLRLPAPTAAQFALIVLISAVLTFLLYEIVRRIPVLRTFLGIGGSGSGK